jgi:hypothetical protein
VDDIDNIQLVAVLEWIGHISGIGIYPVEIKIVGMHQITVLVQQHFLELGELASKVVETLTDGLTFYLHIQNIIRVPAENG